MLDIETIILQYLLFNKEYFERVIPYLDYKLFDSVPHKYIAGIIQKHYLNEEQSLPYDILGVKIQNLENISQENIIAISKVYSSLKKPENDDIESVVKETEKYFKQRKIWLTISRGIEDYDKMKNFTSEFLDNAEEAISYSFDTGVGYDYSANIKDRFDKYKEGIIKIPCSLNALNKRINGGVERKTLNVVVSSTGGGKSVWLCQEAAFQIQQGKNVLYVTLEMGEVQIAKRIDANLLNIRQDDLKSQSQESVSFRFKSLDSSKWGKLIIKEFPADSITSLDVKHLMEQIKRKDKIDIDVLIVDYLGIMGSYRYSTKLNNSYTIGKHAAEELRSLAVQYNIPVWTAIQFNRGAANSKELAEIGMNNVSDSYGIPMGLDLLFALMHTDELDQKNKSIIKILKNRYGESKNSTGLFTILHDWGCAKFSDDPQEQTLELSDDSKSKDIKKMNDKLKADNNKENPVSKQNNTIEEDDGISDCI